MSYHHVDKLMKLIRRVGAKYKSQRKMSIQNSLDSAQPVSSYVRHEFQVRIVLTFGGNHYKRTLEEDENVEFIHKAKVQIQKATLRLATRTRVFLLFRQGFGRKRIMKFLFLPTSDTDVYMPYIYNIATRLGPSAVTLGEITTIYMKTHHRGYISKRSSQRDDGRF